MPPVKPRALIRALAGAGAAALVLGGCSVSVNSPHDDPTTIVHGHALTLDLTKRPTRESFGIPDGKTFQAYQRKGPMLKTTVRLPTGSLQTPAFLVEGGTNAAGGAGDAVTTHQPKHFNVFAVYPTGEQASTAVRDHAKVLGIDAADLDRISGDLGTGTTVPQSRVLHGLVDDWLSVEVVFSDQEGTEVQVQYEFDVDVYHNPAVDKVLHDGVISLDLRHAPTREDLAFLPTYNTADVNALFGKTITARLTTPSGVLSIPTGSVMSVSGKGAPQGEDPQGTHQPRATFITDTGSVAEIRQRLLKGAAVLGIDPGRIREAFTGTGRRQTALEAASTDVYTLTVKVDVRPDQPGQFGGSVSYRFGYR